MNRPRVSVIVPIYKTEKVLKRCLDSLKAQLYDDFEVIMVNDGSPDSSEDICLLYANDDLRFRYCYKDNGGLSDARNKGMELARGEFIMFLDSDDAISPHAISYLLQIMDATHADIVRFCCSSRWEDIQTIGPLSIKDNLITEEVLKHYFYDDVSVYSRIYKASLLEDIRFVVGQISEDVLFVFKSYEKATSLYEVEYPFYFYNLSGESITRRGLSVADNTSVDANLELYDICRNRYPEYLDLAEQQVYKSMFNLVNKQAMRGYSNIEAECFYKEVLPEYVKRIRRGFWKIFPEQKFHETIKHRFLC